MVVTRICTASAIDVSFYGFIWPLLPVHICGVTFTEG
jgi:hypothetical protein